jgi:hypothetical protein
MAKSVLSEPRFHNEEAAFAYVEAEPGHGYVK